ncbi:MAG: thymidylate synthase [Nanoarchaeota archaeon]|nr:thymidylate synthase [Nanoarchaeota archaeon]
MVQQYLEHSKEILTSDYSGFKWGSKGSGLISLFGYQNSYDLRKGFPLLTTKKMATKSIIHELIWFLKGDTNIKYLEDNNCPIWRGNSFEHNLKGMIQEGIFSENLIKKEMKYSPDWDKAMEEYAQRIKENSEFAKKWGEAGPIYGAQWRNWKYFDEDKKEMMELDQLGRVIENMKKNPIGKKHLVSAWNPVDVPKMSLPPCHVMFQMTSNINGELDLQLYQRSCDQFLGVPFNIASYAILTQVIAQELDLTPRRFIHTFGDSHFYTGLEKRSDWYRDNLRELKIRIKNVSKREGYLDVLEWINEKTPSDVNGIEEKYDHVTAILEQMSREPKKLPKLTIAKKPFDKLVFEDFKLENYNSEPAIRRSMAV